MAFFQVLPQVSCISNLYRNNHIYTAYKNMLLFLLVTFQHPSIMAGEAENFHAMLTEFSNGNNSKTGDTICNQCGTHACDIYRFTIVLNINITIMIARLQS